MQERESEKTIGNQNTRIAVLLFGIQEFMTLEYKHKNNKNIKE